MFVVIYKDPDGEEDVCENEKGLNPSKQLKKRMLVLVGWKV